MAGKPLRISIVALGVAAAAVTGVHAFASALRGNAVGLAIGSGWAEGDKYAAQAGLLYISNLKRPPYRKIEALAREGIRRQPLNPSALALLGFVEEARGRDDRAGRLWATAAAISRRDVLTHLAFVNRYAAAGNLEGALEHYDLAMRTNNAAGELMIPILANAIRDPRIQRGFARLIRQRPPWLLQVVDNLSSTTPHPGGLARALMLAGGLPGEPVYREVEQRLLARLVDGDGPKLARAYYLSLPGARAADLAELGFTPATTDPLRAPLAWAGAEDPNASGSFVRQGKALALEGSAAPNASGTLASRVTFLPPGRYRLSGRGAVDGDPGAALTATIRCLVDGRDVAVWQADLAKPLPPLTVAPACAAQRVVIDLDAGEGNNGAEATLPGLRLRPV